MSETHDEYEIRARMLRLAAAQHRARAAALDMAAAAVETTGSIAHFVNALTEAEAREMAQHPDLAELNIQLDALYGDDSGRPGEEPTA